MRVAVDVTPLSVPRSGIGNYLRGAVGALEAAGCEVVPFAVATEPDRQVKRGEVRAACRFGVSRNSIGRPNLMAIGSFSWNGGLISI